jgi:moderate conductance mechanosensitive channel
MPLAQIANELDTAGLLITSGVIVLVGAIFYWVAGFAGRRYVGRMQTRGRDAGARANTLWTVLRRVVLVVDVFLVILFLFLTWGWSIAPFLGVGTVLAAALGFGAQSLVRDFLSGFFILMEDQYQIGDTVTIAGATGTVEDIQLRVTLLRDVEGNLHFVPNGQIQVASNFTSKYAQPVIDVEITYQTDIDKAMEVFADELRAFAEDPRYADVITGEPEVLGVEALGVSGVVLRGRVTTVADQRWAVRREALRRVKNRFDAEGISILPS